MKDNFDKAFIEYGSRVEIDELDISELKQQELKRCVMECETVIEHTKSRQGVEVNIEFGLLMNPKVGAVVTKREEAYFIGVYYGTYVVLRRLFELMLSHESVLSEIGDSSKSVAKKIANPNVDNIYLLAQQLSVAEDDNLISCPERAGIVEILVTNAMLFLVFHELTHVLNGHYDYYSIKTGVMHWKETVPHIPNKNGILPLNMQVLEYDADCCAVNYSLRWIIGRNILMIKKALNPHENYEHISEVALTPDEVAAVSLFQSISGDKVPYNLSSQAKVMKLWMFSVCTLLRINGAKNHDSHNLKRYSHPPSGVRTFVVAATASSRISEVGEKRLHFNVKLHDDAIFNATGEVERAFKLISLDGMGGKGINATIFALNNHSHIVLLERQWKLVRTFIEPYAKVSLAPSQEDLTQLNYNIPYQ